MALKPFCRKDVSKSCVFAEWEMITIDAVVVLFLFVFTENVAEENLFYIVSPKDLVLAKVCSHDPVM